ncbi:MAG: FxLYD domain-containing protein [Methanobacterium sp.]
MNSTTLLCSIGISIIVAAGALSLVSSNNANIMTNNGNDVRTIVQNTDSTTQKAQILNHQLTKPLFNNWEVKGQIKNLGNTKNYYYIINVQFFDKNGKYLNSSYTKIYNLEPGETKDFEVDYQGNTDPGSYNIELRTNYVKR